MKWFRNIKIATKISLVVSTILVLALSTIASFTLINEYNINKSQAELIVKNVSLNNANKVSSDLDSVKIMLQNIENTLMQAQKHETMNREQIIDLLKDTLLKNPDILGIYTLWEPNMFDGKDTEYINQPGYDGTGRFIPYIVRSDNKITIEALMDYDKEGVGDYYLIPKKTGKISILEPFIYKVAGKDILMTTITTPLYDDKGAFVGIVGADINLSTLQESITEIKPLGGYSTLISSKGVYLAYGGDNTKIMTKAEAQTSLWSTISDSTSNGKELLINDVSKISGDEILRVFEPIHLEGTDTYWAIESIIPNSIIFQDFNSTLKSIIIISLIALLVMIVSITYITRRIMKPLKDAVHIADKVAMGDLSDEITIKSGDEIGKLMFSFSKMIENIRTHAQNAKKIAQGNLDFEIEEKSKEDILAISMKQVVNSLRGLISESKLLTQAAIDEKFTTRGNSELYMGGYKEIIEGVNKTLDIVVYKIYWYESLLDSIPFPISVTDNDMNWTFINKPVEQLLGVNRIEMLGKHCSNWNAGICNTENCGINCLRRGQSRTTFEQQGMNFQVDISYLKDIKGKQIGHIEVVQDITAAIHSRDYIAHEVVKLATNLKKLSNGELNLNFSVSDGDKYTVEEKESFIQINNSFSEAIAAISSYIGDIRETLLRLSQGDLNIEITKDYLGDFTEIKDSLNNIIMAFNEVFIDINNAAAQVLSGSRQVSNSAQALSQGTTEQASSVEELTASMDEIATKTKQNAINANQASAFSLEAKVDAEKGNIQMNDMLLAMEQINETSTNISKIIKVIDEIAFQTNILALNAAVEAARAGQQGKGFAVVAEEVRNLAARSANAAKETTALIEGSIKKVKDGTKIANETASSLSKIVEGVTKATSLVENIAIASNEQATGIAQVNKGIMQVSEVVQTNSATSEESAAASEELSSQAELLNDKIARFKLKKSDEIMHFVKKELLLEDDRNTNNKSVLKKIDQNNNRFGKY